MSAPSSVRSASQGWNPTTKRYDVHRFDNYGAWLDRENKSKAGKLGRPLGWGFADPKPPAVAPEEKPFYVQEFSFTSGESVMREYKHMKSQFRLEAGRTDAHHFPNLGGIREDSHYADCRRRSCHVDPTRWKPVSGDDALREAVSDDMVLQRLAAEKGENLKYVDPELLAMQQIEPRLDAAAVRELRKEERVDFSCMELPPQARMGLYPDGKNPTQELAASKTRWALSGNAAPPPPPPEPPEGGHGMPPPQPDPRESRGKWGWCLGGRAAPYLGEISTEEKQMIMTKSLPELIPGHSLMGGNLGGEVSPFHGLQTRKFGGRHWDGRMRGGPLARSGWAGTFPSRELK
eukprot:TRINITY_DN19258_c0_g1_i1.p2 TRINITY_DN19258_c0_g1~~TRINITY_DN19258_c0_g1_i1.p2  ORF type:complete len:347 (+),score=74.27 TRINITY_DN19258_c0_g1_i1:82-1122(+)